MDVTFTKGTGHDVIATTRPDGSRMSATFPKKGRFVHDAVHLVVEKRLGFDAAFWGRIAGGACPEAIGAQAKAGGHASASRARLPDADLVQLVQAERLVECFEAEMWSVAADLPTFRDVLDAGCRQSHVAPPDLSDEDIEAIRRELRALAQRWDRLDAGQSLVLRWG